MSDLTMSIIVSFHLSLFDKCFIGVLTPCSLTGFLTLKKSSGVHCPRLKSKGSKFITFSNDAVGVDLPAFLMVLRVSPILLSSDR